MLRDKLRRMLCFGVILALLACAASLAEGKGRLGYVSANVLKVYDSPNGGAKQLATMGYGQELWVNDWSGGWAQVSNKGGTVGYCKLKGLSAKDPNTLGADVYVRTGGANVYAKPSRSCKSKAKLAAGTRLWAVARTKDGKWLRVQHGSAYGYVAANDLSRTEKEKSVWIVSNKPVAVYASGKLSGKKLGTCSQGDSFKLAGVSGKAAKIRSAGGKSGWVSKSALSASNPNTLHVTAYTQVAGKLLWKNASLSGAAKALKRGAKVEVISRTPDGRWCRVRSGSARGYILSVLLDAQKPPKGGRALLRTGSCKVYGTPMASNDVRARLKSGDAARLVGLTGQGKLLLIRTEGGISGYATAGDWKAA